MSRASSYGCYLWPILMAYFMVMANAEKKNCTLYFVTKSGFLKVYTIPLLISACRKDNGIIAAAKRISGYTKFGAFTNAKCLQRESSFDQQLLQSTFYKQS